MIAARPVTHLNVEPGGYALRYARGMSGFSGFSRSASKSACEIVGVHAAGWNLLAVSAERAGVLDLNTADEALFAILTTNGASNKESAWFKAGRGASK